MGKKKDKGKKKHHYSDDPMMCEENTPDDFICSLNDSPEEDDDFFYPPEGNNLFPAPPPSKDQSVSNEATLPYNRKTSALRFLARSLIQHGRIHVINGSQLMWYNDEYGYYQVEDNPQITVQKALSKNISRLSSRDIKELVDMIRSDPFIQLAIDDLNAKPYFINTRSGVLDWESEEVERHAPKPMFNYCIDADYLGDEDSPQCPTFENFCATSLEGSAKKRQLLLEIIGYCCSDHNGGKCAFFLKGEPDSGKSVMLAFISKLFDNSLIANIPLHKLSDRFMRAELYGKKLNSAGEIVAKMLGEISTFKSITGSDSIEAERKGQDPFFFTPRCKLIFAGNALPGTKENDATKAFTNRLVVLLFNHSIPKEQQDKELLEKLYDERHAIFTLAVRALRDLSSNNFQFIQPDDSKEFLHSFAERTNSLHAFLTDCCEFQGSSSVFNADLCAAYKKYCTLNGLDCYPKTKLYSLLDGYPSVYAGRIRKDGKNLRGYRGITLRREFLVEQWNNAQ